MTTVDRLINGAIDFHVHASPDPFRGRKMDALDLALEAKKTGMRAVVMKCHHYCTAPLAYVVNKAIPDFLMVGSLVLNKHVGGLNPEAVDVAARLGSRVIWMPTVSSVVDTSRKAAQNSNQGKSEESISALGQYGQLVPEMLSILEIIKSYDIVLGTGHISVPEIYALTEVAGRMGIKVTITHPLINFVGSPLTISQQQELVSRGAYIEHCFVACMASVQGLEPSMMISHIKAIGVEHCILSTDFGQDFNPAPPQGFRLMLETLSKNGLSEKELEVMVKSNPIKLLGLS